MLERVRVAVAVSGGVDSTVAALLLRRQGYRLVGLFMRNWDERDETGHCTADADLHEVEAVCRHIDIPCMQVDFVKEYWNDVFSHFLHEYKSGRTPNPDILCNQKIKFKAFYNYAINTLGLDAIATGHYARVERTEAGARLLQSLDRLKDQTYFLCHTSQSVLQRSLFPIGHLMKQEVKRIAVEAGLERTARKKESMGLCFVGKRNFPKFIHEYIEEKQGNFTTLDGRVVGHHKGHHFFTIGQRARIGGQSAPWFVAGKNAQRNTVTVVEGSVHPALFCHSFITSPPHWISGKLPEAMRHGQPAEYFMRYRHQQPLVKCTVKVLSVDSKDGNNRVACLKVECQQPMRAVTPGQYAVFYSEEECLGGAMIEEAGPSPSMTDTQLKF